MARRIPPRRYQSNPVKSGSPQETLLLGPGMERRGGAWGTGADPVPHTEQPADLHSAARGEQKVLLDSRDVSRLLGLGRTKVFEMMARSELPVIRIGRCVRVPREALMEWISNETRLPGRTSGGIR
jgi:excisionase family DNA binding protein